MNTEQLKVIATGMGIKDVSSHPRLEDTLIYPKDPDKKDYTCIIYNPLTNDSQCMEIMKKLEISIKQHFKHEEDITSFSIFASVLHCGTHGGKTINETVCNATYEYFKQQMKQP